MDKSNNNNNGLSNNRKKDEVKVDNGETNQHAIELQQKT